MLKQCTVRASSLSVSILRPTRVQTETGKGKGERLKRNWWVVQLPAGDTQLNNPALTWSHNSRNSENNGENENHLSLLLFPENIQTVARLDSSISKRESSIWLSFGAIWDDLSLSTLHLFRASLFALSISGQILNLKWEKEWANSERYMYMFWIDLVEFI